MSASARLRIAVNLLWLVPGVVGGTETYATGLLRGLAERGAERDIALFTLPSFAAAHPDLAAAFRTVVAPLPPGRRVIRRVTLESTWLPQQLRELRPAVVHHLGGVVPFGGPGPVALTVHDLQYRHFPAYFSRVKRVYLTTMTRRSVRAAAVVMTPSAFTRDDLLARGLGTAGRLRVVPPRLHPPVSVRAQDRDRVRGLLGLEGPFVLYPAAPYPHKNHRVLLDAFARLVSRRPDVHLVLPGAAGAGAWGSAASTLASLRGFVAEQGLGAWVHWPGFLPRADLDALLAEAAVLAFPSRFEGYGLPVVEAMLAGTPVLAAEATALPEVLGRGASAGGRLLPPDDVAAWAEALEMVLTDSAEASRLSAAGRARAALLRAADPIDELLDAWDFAAATTSAETP
jgi:alpha-1,3-rhamnosyl/mannosyltransferase